MKTFHLSILSPERPFYIGESTSITLPLQDGIFGIMANHAPLVSVVIPGEVAFVTPDGERHLCVVSDGMVDVGQNEVKLLCESVLAPDEIDEDAAERDARLAAEDMKGKQSYQDYRMSEMMFAKAVNNLRVKKHDAAIINQR